MRWNAHTKKRIRLDIGWFTTPFYSVNTATYTEGLPSAKMVLRQAPVLLSHRRLMRRDVKQRGKAHGRKLLIKPAQKSKKEKHDQKNKQVKKIRNWHSAHPWSVVCGPHKKKHPNQGRTRNDKREQHEISQRVWVIDYSFTWLSKCCAFQISWLPHHSRHYITITSIQNFGKRIRHRRL